MSEIRDAVERAVFWAAVYDLFKDLAALSKDDAVRLMLEADSERVTATDREGQVMGTLTHSQDQMVYGIIDPIAYRKFVDEHRPDQLVTTINAMFTKWVLAEAERHEGIVGDPQTGQLIPGIGREKRIGTFTLRKTATARARVRDLIAHVNTWQGVALPPAVATLLAPPQEAPDVDR